MKTKENSLAAMRPELAAQWHPTKNGDLTPQDVTSGSGKRVWWLCSKCGHEWQAMVIGRVGTRSHTHRCPVCTNKIVRAGYNDLATTHPDLAAQWHPTKNGYLTPQHITYGSQKRAWWRCDKCGHEWQAIVGNRGGTLETGCPICMAAQRKDSLVKRCDQRRVVGRYDLATKCPELAAQWHPTKNGEMMPHDVSRCCGKKVWWLCHKCGHEWQAVVANRFYGSGCPVCAGKVVRIGFNDLATTRPDLAAQWHPVKNGELTPQNVTSGLGKSVWWRCDKGHEWEAVIASRAHGRGCPVCAGRGRKPHRS